MTSEVIITIDLEAPYPGGEEGSVDYGDLFHWMGVPATFFVTGDVAERRPDLIERLLSQGHEIGSHGWRHPYIGAPPEDRNKYLPELSDGELSDHLGKSIALLREIGADPVGFRAMQFKTDVRVMRHVAEHFKYDSSLTRRQIDKWPEAVPLPVLPVSTLFGTAVRLGTPILFGPPVRVFAGSIARLASDPQLVVYGHSSDLVRPSTPLFTARWKRWWYYDRCGKPAIRVLRDVVSAAKRANARFLTARQALRI